MSENKKEKPVKFNYDQQAISAIRATVIDITNTANSGHPGMAIGAAPVLYTLFTRHLVADPSHPNWLNRDRFVLESGHASPLLYSVLHFAGYDLTLDDLKQFRQLDSITPGHPEVHLTPGVDATSGPLGQGVAQAVGLALGEVMLRNVYPDSNRIIDHHTYVLASDGSLQEGVAQEAISFAGHQQLNKLIMFYDSNDVTLDGPLSNSFSEDVPRRFKACGWNVLHVLDGNNIKAIDRAIKRAKRSKVKPTLIIFHSIIGEGSRNAGTSKVHGSPLGIDDGSYTKGYYQWSYPEWEIPNDVYETFRKSFRERGEKLYRKWESNMKTYSKNFPDHYNQLKATRDNDIRYLIPRSDPHFADGLVEATRKTSGSMLGIYARHVPMLVGGSADVASSLNTKYASEKDFSPKNRDGRSINFGIREFGMASIANGMLLHSGLRTYVGTFLVFSDYMKNAIRMSAIERLPAIYLFSHDSVALGEDGRTHQPIEHLWALRSIPYVNVIRPADARETVGAWKNALESVKNPTCLILSRQGLPTLTNSSADEVAKGGYVISKEKGNKPAYVLIATGSEVSLAIEAQAILLENGIDVRVVSMPSVELFDAQGAEYRDEIFADLPYEKRIAVEMGSRVGWYKYAKTVMGIDTFGESAPYKDIIKHFNFTPLALANIVWGLDGHDLVLTSEDEKTRSEEVVKEEPLVASEQIEEVSEEEIVTDEVIDEVDEVIDEVDEVIEEADEAHEEE